MVRKLLAGVSGAALVALLIAALATPAASAPAGGACQLNGTATFTPNGPGTGSTFGYQATAQLSGCQSNVAGAPTAGSLAIGQQVVETVTIQTPTGPQLVQATYAEPLATGSGTVPVNSCPAGSTQGT